ncbi:MAG: low-specificity L-threonine aldolase [Burkholderiales bacterium]|jgi:threonine aldolase|nr:low-specificity L-threonine aldolase [Burkholderiales bacterium]
MIDLRSDTVTRPTAAMRAAMAAAEVGDDVFGDDPTVNRLQAVLAERLGFEAGLFLPTATQSNLTALMTHCQRGDEYIAGQNAHCYKYEAGGGAVLGSIQPQPIDNAPDGSLPLDKVAAAIKLDDPHYARTRLLCLENTIGGKIVPLPVIKRLTDYARSKGLVTHLDGARLFNAAVGLGVAPREVAAGFDSVTICLSKGLGCPVGAVLAGGKDFIARAKRPRKMLGGGMRQAGVLAAAGLYALDHHVERLAEDHAKAQRLAAGLREIDALKVDGPHTNMVFVDLPADRVTALSAFMAEQGIQILGYQPRLRLVTHLDVSMAAIERAIAAFKQFFARH